MGKYRRGLLSGLMGRLVLVVLAAVLLATADPGSAQTVGASAQKADKRIKRDFFYEPEPLDFNDHAGYVQIFDGVSLKNWDGDPTIWRVEKGAIVGESTKEKPVVNSYIAFRGFEAKDFDLKLEIRVDNSGGSGIQYRSKTGLPWKPRPGQVNPNLNWMMTGPQADFWFPVAPETSEWTGQFYSENTPLGIIAWRGQVVESAPKSYPKLVGSIGDRNALGGYVKVNDWNQYLIMARGGTFIHVINGQLMAVYVDDDRKSSNNQSGLIGIEIEGYPQDQAMRVSVRDIWVKRLD
jgi:3-keto-disaccharide hydrolase